MPGLILCSPVAGRFLRWSSDSTKLWWITGPTVFQYSLKTHSILDLLFDLSFQVASGKKQGIYVFDNVNLITMEGTEVIPNAKIVVSGDSIQDLGGFY